MPPTIRVCSCESGEAAEFNTEDYAISSSCFQCQTCGIIWSETLASDTAEAYAIEQRTSLVVEGFEYLGYGAYILVNESWYNALLSLDRMSRQVESLTGQYTMRGIPVRRWAGNPDLNGLVVVAGSSNYACSVSNPNTESEAFIQGYKVPKPGEIWSSSEHTVQVAAVFRRVEKVHYRLNPGEDTYVCDLARWHERYSLSEPDQTGKWSPTKTEVPLETLRQQVIQQLPRLGMWYCVTTGKPVVLSEHVLSQQELYLFNVTLKVVQDETTLELPVKEFLEKFMSRDPQIDACSAGEEWQNDKDTLVVLKRDIMQRTVTVQYTKESRTAVLELGGFLQIYCKLVRKSVLDRICED